MVDPIHPITPRPPAIPPVADGWNSNPSDAPRERREQQRRERARRERERRVQQVEGEDPYSPGDESPRHIDVRA
jgi:hypothetical protein